MEWSESTTKFIALGLLVLCSAFFSGSETSMMSVNRYRLKHLAATSKRAQLILKMLKRPDRLLGVILIGNTFANILASAIATMLALEFLEESLAVPVATIAMTAVLLIFAEVAPKTLAAIKSERFSLMVVYPLYTLSRLLYPMVWLINGVSNTFLKLFGVAGNKGHTHTVSKEELRTIVHETTARHVSPRVMLLGLLDLESVSVNDIMVPKCDVIGIDLGEDWERVLDQLEHCQHTLLPVYHGDLNAIEGILHVRQALNLLAQGSLNLESILSCLDSPYFVPEGTTLNQQLVNCQKNKRRMALVVDEYGDVQGLITLEDILEEVIGEFTTDVADTRREIHPQADGSLLIDGSITIRTLNRTLNWTLPVEGPKTLSGLIIEYLEMIPSVGTCCLIEEHPLEVVLVKDNMIRTVRINADEVTDPVDAASA